MDVIRLRTMARLSRFDGGRAVGLRVQDLLNTGQLPYLAAAYYNYSNISFLDDILDEMGITDRIEKPGTNAELFREWKKKRSASKTDMERIKGYSYHKKQRKANTAAHEHGVHMSKSHHAFKNRTKL